MCAHCVYIVSCVARVSHLCIHCVYIVCTKGPGGFGLDRILGGNPIVSRKVNLEKRLCLTVVYIVIPWKTPGSVMYMRIIINKGLKGQSGPQVN